ncbi:MAG: VWA domain-containing protein, partial [Myxococcaceae bacterium]|nr:VWA domain-containing protein [Myxococcaceae bacterium]
ASAQLSVGRVRELPGVLQVESAVELPVAVPRYVTPSGQVATRARALAQVNQFVVSAVNDQHADVMLVLDFSGSMSEGFGGATRIDSLEAGVRQALDEVGDQVRFGAVLFSSDVLGQEALQPLHSADTAVAAIKDLLAKNQASGGTNTASALQAAHALMREDLRKNPESVNRQKLVLLVTDGIPNDVGAAEAAARDLWMDADLKPSLFTLHIGDDGKDFMEAVSGPAGPDHDRPDHEDGYYFQAHDAQRMVTELERIIHRLLCGIRSPPHPRVLDEKTVRGFLRPRGAQAEQPLRVAQVGEAIWQAHELAFTYAAASDTVELSDGACQQMLGGKELVLRFNHPRLVALTP